MENLDEYKINTLGLKLQYVADLIYYEKPLLSHFVNSTNRDEHYFYKWSDFNDQCNRWLIFKVSVENLNIFFEEKLTLLQLIQENNFVYFEDLDNNLNVIDTFVCPTQKIPHDYLPSERSFFKENQYEKYALVLKKELQKNVEYLKESQTLEILFKEILAIKNNQVRQDLLLNSIFNNLSKKSKGSRTL